MTEEISTPGTALVIRNASDLNNALVAQRDKAHILTPFTQMMFEDDIFAPGFKPSLREIYIDPVPQDKGGPGEVYDSWEKPGELALTKLGLDKLAQVAGIEWVHVYRVDNTEDPLKASFYAEGRMRLIDGTYHSAPASKSINLNDGSPEANAMAKKPNQLAGARKNIPALAESKAKCRVIRTLLGIKQSFKPEELKKPFVVLKIVPDMNDPEVRKMVQAQMLGMEKYLFQTPEEPKPGILPAGTHGLDIPEPPAPQLPPGPPVSQAPVIDITAQQAPPPAPQPAPGAPFVMARDQKIKAIEDYYWTKTQSGVRDATKPALATLTDAQLDLILDEFRKRPDVRMPKTEELI